MMFDVAVIGAGPGGNLAAKTCANGNLKTLLIEKNALPRDKPCGGWLTPSTLQIIHENFGELPDSLVEKRIEEIILLPTCRFSQEINGASVYRKSFDFWLTEKAKDEGVIVQEATLKSVFQKEDYVVLNLKSGASEKEINAKYVVGADGVGSIVRSTLYPSMKVELAETCQMYVEGQLHRDAIYVYFPLKRPKVTYFWMIPKKEIVVLGVGGSPPINNKELMQEFFAEMKKRFKLDKILKREAYPIPTFSPNGFALENRRILLVGDAACLANPFTGEGIFSSLMSGKLAGMAIKEDFDDPLHVSKTYRKKLKPLISRLRKMHTMYIYYQSLSYKERQDIVKSYFGVTL